ncbi:MAG: S41 family peptidase [Pseudomonadota bacterium]
MLLIVLLCGLFLIVTIPEVVQKVANSQLDNNIHSRDKTASIVSSNHYKEPDYKEVFKHTNSIQDLNEYLKTLDPYSKYLTSKEAIFLEKRNKKYRVGIGLDLLVKGEKILGVPVEQGPAYKAGIVMPAYVRSINDRKIVYSDFSSYSFLTELPAGKVVRLSLENSKKLDKTAYRIEVASHKTDPISYYAYGETLFIRIKKFVGGQNSQLKKILDTSKQYKKLVFDLRYCPGGDIYAMVDMLSFILEKNIDVASLEKANGKNELTLRTLPDKVVAGTPLFILVSEFTASSAELFAWAIKAHYPKAWVIGELTKGKCLAQDMFPFDDGSALKLTTYEVKNSSNQSCQGSPLVPDKMIRGIVLSNTQDIFNALKDISQPASAK